MTSTEFPDTPRGRHARRCGGRCPVHDVPLKVGPGFTLRLDLFPSHDFEAMQCALPFCLDLGESFEDGPQRDPTGVIWCAECVAAAAEFGSTRRQ